MKRKSLTQTGGAEGAKSVACRKQAKEQKLERFKKKGVLEGLHEEIEAVSTGSLVSNQSEQVLQTFLSLNLALCWGFV